MLSHLAVVPGKEVRAVTASLPPALLAKAARAMGLAQGTHTQKVRLVAEAVQEARRAWSAWAVALHWMNAAALALGHKASEHTPLGLFSRYQTLVSTLCVSRYLQDLIVGTAMLHA